MTIEIYADGATIQNIEELEENPLIFGYTTNPTLMRKSGVTNYESFAKEMIERTNKPISFEVIGDTLEDIEREARIISNWGKNVFVKIPPMTTDGTETYFVAHKLARKEIKINFTCLFTYNQIEDAINASGVSDAILSVFAGRIMDTGIDASPFISYAKNNVTDNIKVLWASTRETWNIKQAEESGADIITVPPNMIQKLPLWGKDLKEYSLETVCMFRDDAVASGYRI